MRKYAIPKIAYILLATILICLSIGYTYAYFSAHHKAEGTATLGKTSILWKDSSLDTYISSVFGEGATSIEIDSDLILQRGDYIPIRALLPKENEEAPDVYRNLSLAMSNVNATKDAYCRIQIVAEYMATGAETPEPCGELLQLAHNGVLITRKTANQSMGIITETGWFEDGGYYYYGTAVKNEEGEIVSATLEVLPAGETYVVANQIYLAEDADNAILGSTMSIRIVLEGVQDENDAYQSVWGVQW